MSSNDPGKDAQSDTTRLIGRGASDAEKDDVPPHTVGDRLANGGCLMAVVTAAVLGTVGILNVVFAIVAPEALWASPVPGLRAHPVTSLPGKAALVLSCSAFVSVVGILAASYVRSALPDAAPSVGRWGAVAALLGLVVGVMAVLTA